MSECKHEWKFQVEYSKVGTIRRFKCLTCGAWGWNVPPTRWDNFKEKPIRAYRNRSAPEPEPMWLQPEYRERITHPKADADYIARHSRCIESGQFSDETRMESAVYGSDHFIDPGEL